MRLARSAATAARLAAAGLVVCALPAQAGDAPNARARFAEAVAYDALPSLSAAARARTRAKPASPEVLEIRPERGPAAREDAGVSGEGARQSAVTPRADALAIWSTLANFEGLSNQDNFNVFGFRVNPPDPVGAVGPNHYVQMVNLPFAVFD